MDIYETYPHSDNAHKHWNRLMSLQTFSRHWVSHVGVCAIFPISLINWFHLYSLSVPWATNYHKWWLFSLETCQGSVHFSECNPLWSFYNFENQECKLRTENLLAFVIQRIILQLWGTFLFLPKENPQILQLPPILSDCWSCIERWFFNRNGSQRFPMFQK